MKRDIRFIVTKACNYNCYFCHHEGVSTYYRNDELSVDDYVTLFTIYSGIEQWNGVTISGGEPLLYPNIFELCKSLKEKNAQITLVTNGYFFTEKMDVLKYVNRVNVSIHSLNEDVYNKIVGRENVLDNVIRNLKIVHNIYPNLEIRINITPTIENWSVEMLKDFIEFAKSINASIKFTELFPQSDPNCIKEEKIIKQLCKLGYYESYNEGRPKLFKADNGANIYVTECTCSKAKDFEKPVQFCRETHDLYVTADGKFPLCRLDDATIDCFEDIKDRDLKTVELKMVLALHRVSNSLCRKKIILNNV